LQIGQVLKDDPLSDFNGGGGVETSRIIGIDQENAVTTAPAFGPFPVDEMDFKYIMSTPMMIVSTNIVFSSTGQTVVVDSPNSRSHCYCDMVRAMFRFYWGSTKYLLVFNASNFHSITAVIWWNPDSNTTRTHWQACYHKIVDIKGLTMVDFMVPYVQSTYGDVVGSNDTIFITILAWANPSTAFPIDMNVWKAMASDAGVALYRDSYCNLSCSVTEVDTYEVEFEFNPRAHFLQEFSYFHPGMSGFSMSGIVNGEEPTSIRQILKQMHPYSTMTRADPYYVFNKVGWVNTPANIQMGIEMWAQFFVYYRGGIVMKFLQDANNSPKTQVVYVTDSSTNIIAGFHANTPNNPVLEITVPYYSINSLTFTTVGSVASVNSNDGFLVDGTFSDADILPQFLWKRIKDDFSFVFLKPPPSYMIFSPFDDTNVFFGYAGYAHYIQVHQPTSMLGDVLKPNIPRLLERSSDATLSDSDFVDIHTDSHGKSHLLSRKVSNLSFVRYPINKGRAPRSATLNSAL